MGNRRLVVEVCHASNLMPKDGEGSASPFVEVDFDTQRQRTKAKVKDLNPSWNEKLEFHVADPHELEEECVEAHVYTLKRGGGQSKASMGKVKVEGVHFRKKGEPGWDSPTPYSLERKGLFPHVKGQLFLKIYYYDEGQATTATKKSASDSTSGKSLVEAKRVEFSGYNVKSGTGGAGGNHFVSSPAEKNVEVSSETRYVASESAANFSVRSTHPQLSQERVGNDLVTPMCYLFVNVVKARGLAAKDLNMSSDPYVELKVGNLKARTRVMDRNLNPEWNEVFAFSKEMLPTSFLELTVWDRDTLSKDDFLGFVQFEIAEVPIRQPPDSPLAPQWYRLDRKKDERRVKGEVMLSVWMGTQMDEAFPHAWQSDTGGFPNARSKVYLSPKLWYLRVRVLEAQDLLKVKDNRFPNVFVKGELGYGQALRTKSVSTYNTSPTWNEDLVFVAAEPFEDQLIITVMDKVSANKDEILGVTRISLNTVSKRPDNINVAPKWYDLDKEKKDEKSGGGEKKEGGGHTHAHAPKVTSRVHIAISLDGGYHVLDESVHHSSDTKPTDRRLWKPVIGFLELGILTATNLQPLKTRDGKGCTDAYCVAKYGQKWVRTRTIVDNLNPRWNEPYRWDVYDPCTVLSVGVFDNQHLQNGYSEKAQGIKDPIIGKVRIRLSTLDTKRVYTHNYPLIALNKTGVKKTGEVELAVRFTCCSTLNMLFAYVHPLLPKMHYVKPFMPRQQEILRLAAMRIVIARLARSEPPIRPEVVQYMLDVDSHKYSRRRLKANWHRIMSVFSGPSAVSQWFKEVCEWRNPVTTVLVHMLFLILVWYPELILPTLFLYMFLIGAWKCRFREKHPPHMDIHLSQATTVEPDDLDEEFDSVPTSKANEVVRMRYDRLRIMGGQLQTVLGDLATQMERFHALLSWRDPRATLMFIAFCLIAAVILYLTPFRVIAIIWGVFLLRHPRFRHGMPSFHLNFFRRLPALSDRLI